MGRAYERLVAKQLPGAKHGQWFEFEDAFGHGYCQPDFLWLAPREVMIIEVKLTDTPAAQAQLLDLYFPVVAKAFGKPCAGLVICKHVTPQSTNVVDSLAGALGAQGIPTLHWLGRSPLW